MLKRVSSADMAKRFSAYCDQALNAPIVVTKNGRDRLVMLSVDEFNFLQDLVEKAGPNARRVAESAPRKPRVAARKTTG